MTNSRVKFERAILGEKVNCEYRLIQDNPTLLQPQRKEESFTLTERIFEYRFGDLMNDSLHAFYQCNLQAMIE